MRTYRRLRDDDSYYTYVFPALGEEYISAGVNEYNLDYYCEVVNGTVMGGKLSDLKRYADEYLSIYRLSPEYLKKTSRKARSARYL